MLVAFARNQAVSAVNGTDSVFKTDPVPLGVNDRASAMLGVEAIWSSGGGGASISYQAQVSNDGVNWVNVSGLADTATATTGTTPQQKVVDVNGAYIRFVYTFTVTTATETGGCIFDLHVKLDHE